MVVRSTCWEGATSPFVGIEAKASAMLAVVWMGAVLRMDVVDGQVKGWRGEVDLYPVDLSESRTQSLGVLKVSLCRVGVK